MNKYYFNINICHAVMSGNPRNHGTVILKAFWMRLHHLLNLLRSNKGPVYYFLNMPIFFSHAPWNLHRE